MTAQVVAALEAQKVREAVLRADLDARGGVRRPVRLHVGLLRRGWVPDLPEGVVYVGPGSRWDNPYWPGGLFDAWRDDPAACVARYRWGVAGGFVTASYTLLTAEERGRGDGMHSFGAHRVAAVAPKYLGGKDLACTCPLDRPCHADVLLELANPSADRSARGWAAAKAKPPARSTRSPTPPGSRA